MGKPLKDLTGMRFGLLTVVCRSPVNKGTGAAWHCVCDCPDHSEVDVAGYGLRSGRTKSCGCLRRNPSKHAKDLSGLSTNGIVAICRQGIIGGSTMWKCKCHCGNIFLARQWDFSNGEITSCGCLTSAKISSANSYNLVGKKFGRLTVVERMGSSKWRKALWKCVCDCGAVVDRGLPTDALVWGEIQSCGCLFTDAVTTHGMTGTREYRRILANRRRENEEIHDCVWSVEMEVELRKIFDSCVVCGGTDRLATGHVRSLNFGHGLKPGNAIILCIHCNSRQWTYPPENLPKSLPAYAGDRMIKAAELFKNHWESMPLVRI